MAKDKGNILLNFKELFNFISLRPIIVPHHSDKIVKPENFDGEFLELNFVNTFELTMKHHLNRIPESFILTKTNSQVSLWVDEGETDYQKIKFYSNNNLVKCRVLIF